MTRSTRSTRSNVSYEAHAADSGYLSDLVQAAQRDDDAATALFASSLSAASGGSFSMRSFEDTQWDIPNRGRAKTASLNNSCKELAMHIKTPTRFPIIPLESTLRRAREESDTLRGKTNRRKPAGIVKLRKLRRTATAAVVDSRGRTRAASRMHAAAETTRIGILEENNNQQRMKSKHTRSQVLAPGTEKIRELRSNY